MRWVLRVQSSDWLYRYRQLIFSQSNTVQSITCQTEILADIFGDDDSSHPLPFISLIDLDPVYVAEQLTITRS